MERREFYSWLVFTVILCGFSILAAIAFLMGSDYGVGLGFLIALLCGTAFGGYNTWTIQETVGPLSPSIAAPTVTDS